MDSLGSNDYATHFPIRVKHDPGNHRRNHCFLLRGYRSGERGRHHGSPSGQNRPQQEEANQSVLVDDHPVVRKGIGSCLARHEELEVVGEAADGQEALRKARELQPDIVLMDIEMPHMSGLAATDLLLREQPKTKVLILSMHSNAEYVRHIIESGARGYVLKDAPPEELLKAIEAVNAGDAFFSPDVARVALNQFIRPGDAQPQVASLTKREREVLSLVADGSSNKGIAGSLCVGVRTVETHRERIMHKLGIHTVAGLTKFAIANGFVTMPAELKK